MLRAVCTTWNSALLAAKLPALAAPLAGTFLMNAFAEIVPSEPNALMAQRQSRSFLTKAPLGSIFSIDGRQFPVSLAARGRRGATASARVKSALTIL
jgi:hypothetical protein